jgi:hypothetical protein
LLDLSGNAHVYAAKLTEDIASYSTYTGVKLPGRDAPFITRGWDLFTSGAYAGLGRWGVFMEPNALTFGVPATSGKVFNFDAYAADSTHSTLGFVDQNGSLNFKSVTFTGNSCALSSVNTVSALRALTSTTGPWTTLYLRGYYATGDGGEGLFEYDSSDTTSTDNGGTILVDASDRRWKRQVAGGPLHVRWFGAKGDGSTNDYTAINNAIVASRNNKLYFSPGTYITETQFTLDVGYNYHFEGATNTGDQTSGVTIKSTNTSSGHIFYWDNSTAGNYTGLYISDMTLLGNRGEENTNGCGIYGKKLIGLNLIRVWIKDQGSHGVYLEDSWVSHIERCVITHNYGCGIYYHNRANNVSIIDCTITDNCYVADIANVVLNGSAGYENSQVYIESLDIEGVSHEESGGLWITYSDAVTIDGLYMERAPSLLYADSTVRGLDLRNAWFLDGAVELTSVHMLRLDGVSLYQDTPYTTSLTVAGAVGSQSYVSRIDPDAGPETATVTLSGSVANPVREYGSAAPASGTWAVGDTVWNTAPAAAGYMGWVCTTAGTPGTWKGFGVIQS